MTPPPHPSPPPPSPLLRSLLQAARQDAPSREELAEVDLDVRLHRPPRRGIAAPAAVCAVLALAAALVLAKRPAQRSAGTTALARASADWPTSAPVATPPVATREPAPPSDAASAAPLLPSRSTVGHVARPAGVRLPSPASAEPAAAESASPASAASVETAPPPAAPSGSEADLLDRAAIVLDRNPAEALRLANEHLAGFPSGELSEEREVIAVDALLALGRAGEARARGERFLQQYPRSRRRALMEGMLAR